MKKIILSTVVLMAMANGNSEIEALKQQMSEMQTKLSELENKKTPLVEAPKGVLIKSKVPVIEFSGTHYLGFVNSKDANNNHSNSFETRRNYFQSKAYFEENPKDYMRLTLDTFNDTSGQTGVRLKYAFLYLDNILPNTGIELGQTHRPWVDYEEHNSWKYRSISKVSVEESNAEHLTNSADRGFDLKTKTDYFSSEFGIFNGEGYHNIDTDLTNGSALSSEWRMTGHLLATGKKKCKNEDTYGNVSFFGQQNKADAKHGDTDLNWMGLHVVYNQPEFLISTQYVEVVKGSPVYKGKGYSINGEYRFAPKWNAIGRYDYFDLDDNSGDKKRTIAGITYKYNKNVEFIANYLKEGGSKVATYDFNGKQQIKEDAIMLTADVEW